MWCWYAQPLLRRLSLHRRATMAAAAVEPAPRRPLPHPALSRR